MNADVRLPPSHQSHASISVLFTIAGMCSDRGVMGDNHCECYEGYGGKICNKIYVVVHGRNLRKAQ